MFFLAVLGCVIFIEGIPYFLSPRMVKQVALRVLEMSESSLRIMGLCLLVSGLLFVFLATRAGV
jgi:uncharacterized protein YjeT (DUF2065 family)